MAGLPRFTLLAIVAVLIAGAPVMKSFQGMATSSRSARPANIQTNLPPIQVDIRDVAEEAGLSAINVSGSKDSKKYILETTGSGVAIFDADGDGLMDVFLVNGTTLDGSGEGATATGHL